ncbi:DUF6946 family protein [Novosphingobium panipatense]
MAFRGKGDATARPARLERLCRILDLDPSTVGTIRYQLIHRTASAVIEAQRYCSRDAAMIVQSFCPKRSWVDDYRAFAEALGFLDAPVGAISPAKICDGVALRIGWVAEPGGARSSGSERHAPFLRSQNWGGYSCPNPFSCATCSIPKSP